MLLRDQKDNNSISKLKIVLCHCDIHTTWHFDFESKAKGLLLFFDQNDVTECAW